MYETTQAPMDFRILSFWTGTVIASDFSSFLDQEKERVRFQTHLASMWLESTNRTEWVLTRNPHRQDSVIQYLLTSQIAPSCVGLVTPRNARVRVIPFENAFVAVIGISGNWCPGIYQLVWPSNITETRWTWRDRPIPVDASAMVISENKAYWANAMGFHSLHLNTLEGTYLQHSRNQAPSHLAINNHSLIASFDGDSIVVLSLELRDQGTFLPINRPPLVIDSLAASDNTIYFTTTTWSNTLGRNRALFYSANFTNLCGRNNECDSGLLVVQETSPEVSAIIALSVFLLFFFVFAIVGWALFIRLHKSRKVDDPKAFYLLEK